MWPRMCGEFNWFLKEKIHLVLLNQSDELEGFTIPNWDWIEVSANPGADFYRQRGRMDWLPDVLVHEFAHVVSLKANATMAEGTQAVSVGGLYSDGVRDAESGAEINIMDSDPFYWTEGGAEYWSDEAGYNWWTPSRDMHIRTTVLEDRLLSYDEWQTRVQSMRWGDGERGYQQGYSFALYLRQRFGNQTYQQFAIENSKGWNPDWNVVIERVTGVAAETLYNDWVAYITKKYNDQYAAVKAEGEVVGQELGWKALDWEYEDPSGRDAFYDLRWKRKKGFTNDDLARIEREKAKEKTGTWSLVPKMSADGKWLGVNSRGLIAVGQVPEQEIPALKGKRHGRRRPPEEGLHLDARPRGLHVRLGLRARHGQRHRRHARGQRAHQCPADHRRQARARRLQLEEPLGHPDSAGREEGRQRDLPGREA
jgi:hypothetical protein